MTTMGYHHLGWLLLIGTASVLPTASSQAITSLAGGSYTTYNDVAEWANLALDVADMREAATADEKTNIYMNGKNAKSADGTKTRTLASLSLDTFEEMKGDPIYNFFRHGFLVIGDQVEGEEEGLFDEHSVNQYANTLVTDLLVLGKLNAASEAAIVMNIWMYCVHQLYEISGACKRNDTTTENDMKNALDKAAALWIGVGQDDSDSESGNMLYNIAEKAGARFGQDTQQDSANRKVLIGFESYRLAIQVQDCADNPEAYEDFRVLTRKLVGHMTIPLVQTLIHHIMEKASSDNSDFIELYALAIGPRVEACVPTAYEDMLNVFVKNNFQEDEQVTSITLLQSIYSCLEVSCADIGSYRTGEVAACTDEVNIETVKFAGYPLTFDARAASRIDRDIEQIRILSKARAYEAALDYYDYGNNAFNDDSFLSLKDLATSPGRTKVTTQFGEFTGYFGSNEYADKMVRDALQRKGDFTGANTAQAAELVSGILTSLVMYMAVLEKVHVAVSTCREVDGTNASVLLMDEAVGFYVGSIEGDGEGGRDGGQLLFAVAKQLCNDFDACTAEGNASVNDEIMQAFAEMSDQLTIGECDNAEASLFNVIAPALIVPLIQGTLKYAVINEQLEKGASNATLAIGFTFSRSILPLIDAVDAGSGPLLAQNMDFTLIDKPVADGAAVVFGAVKSGLQKLTSPQVAQQCQNIGVTAAGAFGDVCDGLNVTPVTSAPTLPPTGPVSTPNTPTELVTSPPTPSPVEPITPLQPTVPSELGFGRYTFVHDVDRVAALALDVNDMKQAPTVAAANNTYMNGGNAFVSGSDRVVSLAALSLTAADDMNEDPVFNIFRWALLSEDVFESINTDDFDPVQSAYAHIVTSKALGVAQDQALAAETSVVLSVWMEICHNLFNAIDYCSDNNERSVLSIDRAVALWIGTGQSESTFDGGFMMYNIAQQGEKYFGLASGEALANTKIIDSFVDAQQVSERCENDSANYLELKIIVAQVMKQMTIPLLQNLFYFIDQKNENYIELYALAVIPQAIGCGASDFVGLRDVLVSEKDFSLNNIDDAFFAEMQRFQRCLRITCDDLIGNTNPESTLRELIDNSCVKDSPSNSNLAGFETDNDVYELSRLDLDILQIGIFMETKAYAAAEDYYVSGYNSQGALKPISLKELAKSSGKDVVPQYKTFSDYFASENYADDLVQRAIRRADTFEDASRDQAAEAVTRGLQGMVSYMAVLEKLYDSVQKCKQGSGAVKSLEEGVALFVGSLEGSERGGNGAWDGTLLYALGKETCDAFGTCEASNNADVNEDLLEVLDDAKALLEKDDCDGALAVIENEVLGDLPVAMLQALLYYTVENAGMNAGNQTYPLAAGYVFSRAVLPLVNAVNATSGSTLAAALDFDLTKKPVASGIDAVYEAITFALPGINVDCDDIATFGSRDVCDNTAEFVRPDIDTSTNLGNGIYTTTTYVEDRAAIAKDIVTIMDALTSGSIDLARVVYKDGDNSNVYNDNGIKVGQRSLQKFSTQNTLDMVNEPLFNIYRYALQDDNGQFLNKDVRFYADSIIEQLLSTTYTSATEKTLPAEGMLVLNLWMYLAHELFETLSKCKNKAIADDDGVHSIDEAVAYWIGDGQQAGDGDTGHLFYALAERMGDKFQQNVNGQSRTNVNIIRLFTEAKGVLTLPNACTDNPTTYPQLRLIVYRILSQMTIPIIQSLIHNLRENDQFRVKLYAQAFAPLTAACDPELFEYLQLKLIGGTYNVIEAEEVVERIRTSFDCLGITCDDVGQHISETDNICLDTPKQNPLAGYTPNADVRDYAQLDLDILEAGILMDMGALAAVEDLYDHGKHALINDGITGPKMLTLAQMATTSDRSVVPNFDSFVRYFDSNKYSDGIIRKALNINEMPNASTAQRKEIVVKSMQYLVIYMAVLQAMHDAIAGCSSTDASRVLGGQEAWDRAAALLIGSIEGNKAAGTANGQSFYALGKKRCAQFGTCGSGTSLVNEKLMSLLYTGRGELEGGGCSALRRAVSEIEPLLLVPLIQSNIRYAISNTRLDTFPTDGDFAEGYVFSRAVLPLVEDVDRDAAETINRNMNLIYDVKPVRDGSLVVINAFAKTYNGMKVNCELIGTIDNVNACNGVNQTKKSGLGGGAIFGIVFAVLVVVAVVGYLIFARMQSKKRQGPELAPMFRRSNGVMNHNSDILLGKHNDAAIIDGDEAFVHRMQHQADALSMA